MDTWGCYPNTTHREWWPERVRCSWAHEIYDVKGQIIPHMTRSFLLCTGTAGVIISLSRIFTKILIQNEKENTIIFFGISITMVLMCFVLHLLVQRTRFVRYYTGLARRGLSYAKDHSHHGNQYQVHHDVITEEVRFVSYACHIWTGQLWCFYLCM